MMQVIQTYCDEAAAASKLYVGVVAMRKDIKAQLLECCGTSSSIGNKPAVLAYTTRNGAAVEEHQQQARGTGGILLEPNVSRVLWAVQKTFKPLGGGGGSSSSGDLVSLWCRESTNSLFCLKPQSFLSVEPRFKNCTECPCVFHVLHRGKIPNMLLMRADIPQQCISIFQYIKFTDMERQISFVVGKKDFVSSRIPS